MNALTTTPVEIPLDYYSQAYYLAQDIQVRNPEMFGGTLVDSERVLNRALAVGMELMREQVYGRHTASK